MKAKLYLHSEKSDMYYTLTELGLSDELAWKARYMLYEVAVEVDIDETTGEYIIEKVIDGDQVLERKVD